MDRINGKLVAGIVISAFAWAMPGVQVIAAGVGGYLIASGVIAARRR